MISKLKRYFLIIKNHEYAKILDYVKSYNDKHDDSGLLEEELKKEFKMDDIKYLLDEKYLKIDKIFTNKKIGYMNLPSDKILYSITRMGYEIGISDRQKEKTKEIYSIIWVDLIKILIGFIIGMFGPKIIKKIAELII